MGVIQRIFKRGTKVSATAGDALVTEPAVFSQWGGDAYASDIYRGAVDTIARHCGKLKGCHVIKYADHSEISDCKLNRLLQTRPNPYMSSYDFIYKMVTRLFLYNNSFAFIDRDLRGNAIGFYPITANFVEMLSDDNSNLWVRFTFNNGQQSMFSYDDLIHLRRHFNNNDLLGDDNGAIYPALELAQTQNDGIINGIKAGANIRGILHFEQIMSPAKLQEERDAFVSSYLQISNDGGVVAVDQKMQYTPIESKPVMLDADQTAAVAEKIYSYLGISKEIVTGNFTDDQFNAFYESTVEPIALSMSEEFTAKLFNDREQAFGNAVIFDSGRLLVTSNTTKITLISQIMPMGLLTVNQALEILNLPGVPDGDKRLQSLNYVDQTIANSYQLGKNNQADTKGAAK